MKEKLKKIFLTYQLLAILLIVLDQLSKILVRHFLDVDEVITIIPHFFYFTLVYNTGAAFSGFSNLTWILTLISLISCVGLEIYLFKNQQKKGWLKAILLVLIAGAFGNFIDRLIFKKVTDFIGFIIFGYHFAIFNVADICVTLSCIGLLIYAFVSPENHSKKEKKLLNDSNNATSFDASLDGQEKNAASENHEGEHHES